MVNQEAIDAVITWVDGHDEQHRQKVEHFLNLTGLSRNDEAALPTRFNQQGEIDYCLRSLLFFAPWLRTIHIVTDSQTPSIYKQVSGTCLAKKIKIIDHQEIFPDDEKYLPTFNSLSIESVLWRIPNLTNSFIYLNDDCSLIRPINKSDFFRENRVVLRGEWKIQTERKWRSRIKNCLPILSCAEKLNEHRRLQENSAKMAGFNKRFFHLPHIPFALKRDVFEQFFLKHPHLLTSNISYKFRNAKQFWPISLLMHLELQNKPIILDKTFKAITVNGACHSLDKIKKRLSQADKKKDVAFICMQSIDVANQEAQKWMFNWLEQRIPSLEFLADHYKSL
nr:capsular biosynthesis protein [Legionella jordanis]